MDADLLLFADNKLDGPSPLCPKGQHSFHDFQKEFHMLTRQTTEQFPPSLQSI